VRLVYEKRTASIRFLILRLVSRCALWSLKYGNNSQTSFIRTTLFRQIMSVYRGIRKIGIIPVARGAYGSNPSAFSDLGGKMRFLGHNFGSKHTRRSSKGSIDAGDRLVFTKRLSQNFGPLDWRPGPVKGGQKNEKPQLCEPLPSEPLTQIKKFFLIEPRRLAASVEGLNNFLAIAAGEL